jgi:hypothetical protein
MRNEGNQTKLRTGPELDNIPVSNIKDGIEPKRPEYWYGNITNKKKQDKDE